MYRLPILICLLAVAAPAFPDEGEAGRAPEAGDGRIYRMTDGQGRVIFTDSPPPGAAAEEVHQSRPNTLPPPPRQRLENRRANEPQPDAFKGYTLSISAPAHEQTFQNPQEPIAVQVSLTPPLQGEHSLRVLHNGEPLPGRVLDRPVRGAHTLKAQVLDAGGEVVQESEPVTIYVHRPSALLGPGARRNAPEEGADKKGSGLVQILPWYPASR